MNTKKNIFDDELIQNIGLTQQAANFICDNFDPVSYTDFTGYIIDIGVLFPKKIPSKSFCLLVPRDGKFKIIPFVNGKKKLTVRFITKIIKCMLESSFIADSRNEPFLEYSTIYNLPIDASRVHFFEERLLKERNTKCQ